MTRRTESRDHTRRGHKAAARPSKFRQLLEKAPPKEGPVQLVPTPFRLMLQKDYGDHTISYDGDVLRRYSEDDWYQKPSAQEVARFIRDVLAAARLDSKIAAFIRERPERRHLFYYMG